MGASKNKIVVKSALLCILMLVIVHSSRAQFFHTKLDRWNGFGIEFERPDTITSLSAFDRNDTTRFLSFDSLVALARAYGGYNTSFEKQQIKDENNVFTCIRFKTEGIWFRYTFWIRLLENGQPAFRQRIYVDPDLNDYVDSNDLLVFQADYHVFEVYDPRFSPDPIDSLENTAILEYIDDKLTLMCKLHGEAWYALNYPEYGYVTTHTTGLYGDDYPQYIEVWTEQRALNDLHEFYLGRENISGGSSFFFLCYPVGDVQALFLTGTPWVQYHQFAKMKRPFSTKIVKKVKPMGQRNYYVGLDGVNYRYSTVDLLLAEEVSYLNGFEHGYTIQYESTDTSGIEKIRASQYAYDEFIKEVELEIKSENIVEEIDPVIFEGIFDPIEQKGKAYRSYKKHCRKWRIARTKK